MGLGKHYLDKPEERTAAIRLEQLQRELARRQKLKLACLNIIKRDFQLIAKPKAIHKVPQLQFIHYLRDRVEGMKTHLDVKVIDSMMFDLECVHVDSGNVGRFYKGIAPNDPKLFRMPPGAKDPSLLL